MKLFCRNNLWHVVISFYYSHTSISETIPRFDIPFIQDLATLRSGSSRLFNLVHKSRSYLLSHKFV